MSALMTNPSVTTALPVDVKIKYRLSLVEAAGTPVLGQIGSWHRYVIEGGSAPIVGHHRGSKLQTEEYALEFAENLNHRWRCGIVVSGYRSSKRDEPKSF